MYRCTESGASNYVIKVTPTTPKIVKKYSPQLRKLTDHKLSEKTK